MAIAAPEKNARSGMDRKYREEGRAPTENEIGRINRKEFLYFQDKDVGKVTHWYPCAERKSYERGAVFVFRMLGAVEEMKRHGKEIVGIVPGRDAEGKLHPNMVRLAGVVDNLGLNQQVCFLPSLPYVPEHRKYERYSGPLDNPYAILRRVLWEKGKQLKKPWVPLIMSKADIDAYRAQENMKSTLRSEPFLPMVRSRYFAYAQMYAGYNTTTNEEFEFDGIPYGGVPEDGLQIVSFNEQAYLALVDEYSRKFQSKDQPDRYFLADPADPEHGPLNYIYNGQFPNPVSGNKKKGIGYDATVSGRFHRNSKQGQSVDLKLSEEFVEWFIGNRMPWSTVLKGTYGVEQVYLLARAFPELKGPAKLAWDNHPLLMEAWEQTFDGPDDYDFLEHLHGKYAEDQDADETDVPDETTTKRRNPVSIVPSRLRKELPDRREPVQTDAPDWEQEPVSPEETDVDPFGAMASSEWENVEPDIPETVVTTAAAERTAQTPMAGRAGAVTRPGASRGRLRPASRQSSLEEMRLGKKDFQLPFETEVAAGVGASPDDTEVNVF